MHPVRPGDLKVSRTTACVDQEHPGWLKGCGLSYAHRAWLFDNWSESVYGSKGPCLRGMQGCSRPWTEEPGKKHIERRTSCNVLGHDIWFHLHFPCWNRDYPHFQKLREVKTDEPKVKELLSRRCESWGPACLSSFFEARNMNLALKPNFLSTSFV